MRSLLRLLFACSVVTVTGCYQRPGIPLDRPLSCAGTDAASDCPNGFACVLQVCAPRSCVDDQDCPANLVCNPMRGCLRRGDDGGAIGEGGVVIPGSGLDGGSVPTVDGAPGPSLDVPGFDSNGAFPDGGVP